MSGLRMGVVVNPTAGRGRGDRRGHHLLGAARGRGHDVLDLSADDLEGADRHARQAVVDGLDALVVVGGDGMVHLGVNVVAGTDLPLGIVAAGSGNDIARYMGLPQHDVTAAVAAIERGLESGGAPSTPQSSAGPTTQPTSGSSACCRAGSTPPSTRERTS